MIELILWARHVQAASLQWLKSSTWSISLIIAVLYHIITIASLKINDINKMHKLADMVSSSITVHNRSINDWLGDIMQYWWCDWICADYRAWHFHNCQMRCWGGAFILFIHHVIICFKVNCRIMIINITEVPNLHILFPVHFEQVSF